MRARFIKSAAAADGFPEDTGLEVAVVGRSNSGKSSAINRVVGSGKIARVSKTPGRTQLINFFELGEGRRLVDLPGYGFARVPEAVRRQWQVLIDGYFRDRRSLAGLLLTVDIRRGLLEGDRAMLEWAAALQIPVMILLTKADKLSRGAAAGCRLGIAAELGEGVGITEFSALDGRGVDTVRDRIDQWLAGSG